MVLRTSTGRNSLQKRRRGTVYIGLVSPVFHLIGTRHALDPGRFSAARASAGTCGGPRCHGFHRCSQVSFFSILLSLFIDSFPVSSNFSSPSFPISYPLTSLLPLRPGQFLVVLHPDPLLPLPASRPRLARAPHVGKPRRRPWQVDPLCSPFSPFHCSCFAPVAARISPVPVAVLWQSLSSHGRTYRVQVRHAGNRHLRESHLWAV